METPAYALTLAYWLHMLATVVWVGSLAALSLVILPILPRSLDALSQAKLLESLQRRLDPLGWFCLLLLVGTGMFQMSAHPSYRGFLAVEDRWALAILIKHILFLGMIAVSAYLTWGVLPVARRQLLRLARGGDAAELVSVQRQNARLLRLNFLLAAFVLALTALARVS